MNKHTYDYTIETRRIERDDAGNKSTHWDRREVTQARDLTEVKERLRVKNMDDLRYITKHIIEEETMKDRDDQIEREAEAHDLTDYTKEVLYAGEANNLPLLPPAVEHLATGEVQILLPTTPARTVPTAPLRPKRAQTDKPLPLETVYINASQGRLF